VRAATPDADLVVVGAGPAGLATAIDARLTDLSVVVLERRRPPIDKACGEGLMPDAVARLAELGIQPGSSRPFRGIRYLDGPVKAEGVFPAGQGLGVRRTELYGALQRRAEEVGAAIRWGVAASGLADNGVETDAGPVTGRWIVGADGLHSRMRRWAGLEGRPAPRQRFGVRRHYAVAPWTDLVEVYWTSRCEAYVTPVGPDLVGVALLWSGEKAGFDHLLQRFPSLQERLSGAAVASRDRGAGPLEQRVSGVWTGRCALVGDAAGYLDAITGEGLGLAFHQAAALVEAIRRGDLALYARAHRRLGRVPDAITRLLLALDGQPRLRRRVMRALAAEPGLFSRLLGIHSRTLKLRQLGAAGTLRLLARLALA
jgi:flavin-dependent dehydrogenase